MGHSCMRVLSKETLFSNKILVLFLIYGDPLYCVTFCSVVESQNIVYIYILVQI